jgi:UDP-glucose 4-epimerase
MVTGGRGFIGTHLVELLANNNLTVVSIDIKNRTGKPAPGVVDVIGDLRDHTLMRDVFAGRRFDCIFDLASLTTMSLSTSSYRSNVEQTQAMVGYCLKYDIRKYIYYSTQFVYRKRDCFPKTDDDYAPVDAYGESKVKSEELVKASLPRDKFLVLRPTYIWGPGLERFRDGLLYRLLKAQLIISSDPNMKRYYGYVETVAAQTLAFSRIPVTDLPRRVYYVSDEAIGLGELCKYLVSALGRGKAWSAPASLIHLLGAIGELNSKLGLPAPISSLQARELTFNFPVPIEPTLTLTGCATDLPSAAAKTVAWAVRTDKRFQSAIGAAPVTGKSTGP